MHSTNYIIRFTIVMTVVVAFVLALMVSGLKDIHTLNESVYNKKGILSAVSGQLGKDISTLSEAEVGEIFSKQIEQKVINTKGEVLTEAQIMEATGGAAKKAEELDLAAESKKPEASKLLPLYVFTNPKDQKKYNIIYVRGKGLWDEIWGYITLSEDWNTIAGQAFDHKGETPGLGAEIKDNKAWYGQYTGKKLYDPNGKFVSVSAVKGGVKVADHQVDAISGATITGNGVNEMLMRGVKYYEAYVDKNRTLNNDTLNIQ